MKKFLDWIKGTFVFFGVFCYCVFASFMLLFFDEE
jgi:hypothetical protein